MSEREAIGDGGKTLLLSEIFPPRIGGSGSWFWEIYRRLPRETHAVLAGTHPDTARFDAAGTLDIVRADLSSPTWSLMEPAGLRYYARMFGAVRGVARSRKIAQLQCARVMPEGIVGWAASSLLRLPYTVFVHGEDIKLALESRESRLVAQRVLGRASRLICNSENSARMLREDWSLGPERVRVMHPGVDTERFAPTADTEALRERFGWRGRKVVLTVSRLEKRKGHDRMIEAMSQVKAAVPEALYAIVGDGEEREGLERAVRERGLERWVSLIPPASEEDLPRYYRASDLFILPPPPPTAPSAAASRALASCCSRPRRRARRSSPATPAAPPRRWKSGRAGRSWTRPIPGRSPRKSRGCCWTTPPG